MSNASTVESRHISPDDPIPGVKNVVLVVSGKGGVGKSTVAANLAMALHRRGAAVGLLDADMYGPSVPTLFGIHESPRGNGEGKIVPLERHGLKLMSIGFLLEDPKAAIAWRGPMLHSALVQFFKDVAWGELDYLVIDLPPGTGDVSITLSQQVRATGAVIVTTPQDVAVQDVYKSVSLIRKVGVPILGVVENQSYFLCEHGTRYELFGKGGGERVATMAEAPLLAQVPLEPAIGTWGDAGTPIVEAAPSSPSAKVFFALADKVRDRIREVNAEHAGHQLVIDRSGGAAKLPVVK